MQLLAIPVYNEEESVRGVVEDALHHLGGDLEEILLIDDGSTDASPRILTELSRQYDKLLVIRRPINRGYGATVIEALDRGRERGYDFVITMDCDRQHRPEDLFRFVRHDPAVDVVSGSRYLPESGRSGEAPSDRVEINSRITKRLNRMYGWNLTDSFCGFKRFKIGSVPSGLLHVTGYSFPLEFWAFSARFNLNIVEIPVQRIYTTDDRSFGEDLDRQRKRLRYYLETLREADRRFKASG